MKSKVTCPNCGRKLAHQGALNLHLPSCLSKNPGANGGGQAGQGNEEQKTCENGCKWRLLNAKKDEREGWVIHHGYTEVCDVCKEVR